MPIFDRSKYASAEGLRRGGYVIADCEGDPELILIATGSEVELAIAAHEDLVADGVRSRVVSLPSWSIFDRQDEEYRESVLPKAVTARVSIEEGSTLGWDRYVGTLGRMIGMHTFGSSAPAEGRAERVWIHAREGRRDRPLRARSGGRRRLLMSDKATQQLHDLGQSLWVDNITRKMLDEQVLDGYIDDLSVTGLTSNPTIFDKAIGSGDAYDEQISELQAQGKTGEDLFFELALTDLKRAAKLFEPINERTDDVDGWVSLEVSPLLADDTEATIAQAAELHSRATGNFFIKIPGTEAGRPAIEESIFAGIPVNVTLLFDREQYLGAADAHMRGLERRIEAGLSPSVPSVASVFLALGRRGRRGGRRRPQEHGSGSRSARTATRPTARCWRPIAVSGSSTRARGRSACSSPARAPRTPTRRTRSTSTRSRRPHTVNTMPEPTLLAFADHGKVPATRSPRDGGDAGEIFAASSPPASTSTRSRRGSSRRARSRSTSRGTTCSARSSRSGKPWPPADRLEARLEGRPPGRRLRPV